MEIFSMIILAIIVIAFLIYFYDLILGLIFVMIAGTYLFSGFGVILAIANSDLIEGYPFTSILVSWLAHTLLTIVFGLLMGFISDRKF